MAHDDEILFCIPIFNDWETARLLLGQLGRVLNERHLRGHVLFVDDGSTDRPPGDWQCPAQGLSGVDILTLRRNVGHQRAIALGLAHAYVERRFDAVIVMDGDGEDAPSDALKLYDHWTQTGRRNVVVFARRSRRSESLFFRAFYHAFKLLHVVVTGRNVEVGNFSLVPFDAVARLVVSSEIWNHYSAGVFKSRLPTDQIPIPRAKRLAGESRMNFAALAIHGLSAISVYGERVGVRIIIGLLAMLVATGALTVTLAWARHNGHAEVPMLLLASCATFAVMLSTGLFVALGCLFLVLHGRSAAAFLPVRDYKPYVVHCIPLPSDVVSEPSDRLAQVRT